MGNEPLSIDYRLLVPVVTALVAVIGILWREMKLKHEATVEDLKEQKERNLKTDGKVLELTEKVGHLSGYNNGVDDIAAALIKQIRGG